MSQKKQSQNQQKPEKQAPEKSPEKSEDQKSLAEKDQDSLQIATDNSSLEYKGNEESDAGDIIIPRLLLMQGTSPWVPDTFQQGDLINSLEEELLAKKGETVEIVPFCLKKTWVVLTDENPPKWIREEPWHSGNDDLPWQFSEDDEDRGVVDLKRQRNYGFYAMLVKDLTDPFPIPVLVNFRSSAGFKPGKKIASHFSMMKGMNQPGFNVTWHIGSETVKNEDGDKKTSYQRFTVKKGRMVTKEEMEPMVRWLSLMSTNAQSIKHHETVEDDVTETPTAPRDATPPPEGPQASPQF